MELTDFSVFYSQGSIANAEATLKDNKGGALVLIFITDDLTLDKFKDKRIGIGDEIRTRFDKGDKNLSKSFKKTAGC